MICPSCGATNRDGASYCDSCGTPLTARLPSRSPSEGDDPGQDLTAPPERVLDSGGIVGWMAFDWTARFVLVAFFGILIGFVTLGMALYLWAGFFFLLAAVGIAGTWYMLHAEA